MKNLFRRFLCILQIFGNSGNLIGFGKGFYVIYNLRYRTVQTIVHFLVISHISSDVFVFTPIFNKGLAPSFNVARVGFANLPFSMGLYPLLNGKASPAA